jgi:hypothetical protein
VSTSGRRHSPAVYRRRRLALLLVLLVVVAVVWLLIARPWQAGATPAAQVGQQKPADPVVPAVSSAPQTPVATPDASTSPTPGASASPTPGASSPAAPSPGASAAPCATADIAVKAVTDKTSYPSGTDPKLSVQLTNTGSTACMLNVGTSAQVFTITSGSDTWWRSTDCQSEPSDMYVILAAGQKVASAQPIVWDRSRSSVATCQAKDRPKAPGGGATYHLSVSVGGIDAVDDALFQLH